MRAAGKYENETNIDNLVDGLHNASPEPTIY